MGGIRYEGADGAPPPVTSFSDPLTVAAPFFMGQGWWCCVSRTSARTGVDLDSSLNIGGTGLVIGDGINNFNLLTATMNPSFVDNTAIRAGSAVRGEFAEMTFVQRTAGLNCTQGFGVMMAPSEEQGYFLVTNSVDGGTIVGVNRYSGGFGSGAAIVAGGTTYVANDVLRLEAIPETGQTRIRVKKNGVIQSNVVDNNVNRLSSGLYGMCILGINTGQMVWKNFNAGLL